MIGDSHARAWIPAFDAISEAGGWTAYYLVKPQCTAAHVTVAPLGDDRPFTDCSDFQDWVIDQVDALEPDLVVVASSPPVNGVFDGDAAGHHDRRRSSRLLRDGLRRAVPRARRCPPSRSCCSATYPSRPTTPAPA